jgi:hypothetical protein
MKYAKGGRNNALWQYLKNDLRRLILAIFEQALCGLCVVIIFGFFK